MPTTPEHIAFSDAMNRQSDYIKQASTFYGRRITNGEHVPDVYLEVRQTLNIMGTGTVKDLLASIIMDLALDRASQLEGIEDEDS